MCTLCISYQLYIVPTTTNETEYNRKIELFSNWLLLLLSWKLFGEMKRMFGNTFGASRQMIINTDEFFFIISNEKKLKVNFNSFTSFFMINTHTHREKLLIFFSGQNKTLNENHWLECDENHVENSAHTQTGCTMANSVLAFE